MRVTWRVSETVSRLGPSLGAPEDWLAAAAEAAPVRLLTQSRTTDTALIEVPGLGRVIRKCWRWPGVRERLKGVGRTTALARTPAEREFTALGRTYGGDLRFHPAPLAFRVIRRGGLAYAALLLMEEIPDAVELAVFLRDEAEEAVRERGLGDLATRLAAMHADGVTDGDCHPRNVLVQPGAGRAWKVDCGRQRSAPTASARRSAYDLACLDVGLEVFCSAVERAAFFTEYARARRINDVASLRERVESFRRRIASEESRRLPPPASE